jgi:hypothetical protein
MSSTGSQIDQKLDEWGSRLFNVSAGGPITVAALNATWNVAAIEVGVVTTLRMRMPGLFVASDAPVRFVPASETLTEVPALPIFGVKAVIVGAPTPPVLRVMESRLPTASYW